MQHAVSACYDDPVIGGSPLEDFIPGIALVLGGIGGYKKTFLGEYVSDCGELCVYLALAGMWVEQ